MNGKENTNDISIHVFVILALLNSGYALNTTELDFSFPVLFLFVAGIFLLGIIKNRSGFFKVKINGPLIMLLYFWFLFIGSYLVNLNVESGISMLRLIMLVWGAYLFVESYSFDAFMNVFILYMRIICIIGIVTNLLFEPLSSILPEVVNSNGVIYESGFVFFFVKGIQRLCGIFWEPGILAMYICFALIVLLMHKPQYKKTLVIYIVALVMTQSTTGYAIGVLIAMLAYLHKNKNVSIRLIILMGIVAAIFLAWDYIIVFLLDINYDTFVKLTTLQHESTGTRLFSLKINYEIFRERMLWGWGYSIATEKYNDIMNSTYALYHVGSQTSTTGVFLSAFGIGGAFYTVFWVVSLLKSTLYKKLEKVLLIVITLILINVEPNTFFLMTYIFLFYWIKNCKLIGIRLGGD